MGTRFVENDKAYFAAELFARPREEAGTDRVELEKILLIKAFGIGWLSGLAAGAGLLAIFLQR